MDVLLSRYFDGKVNGHLPVTHQLFRRKQIIQVVALLSFSGISDSEKFSHHTPEYFTFFMLSVSNWGKEERRILHKNRIIVHSRQKSRLKYCTSF